MRAWSVQSRLHARWARTRRSTAAPRCPVCCSSYTKYAQSAETTSDGGAFIICRRSPSEPCQLFARTCTSDAECASVAPRSTKQCDLGNQNGPSPAACSTVCLLNVRCGDGVCQPGDECDDGNLVSGDGCSSSCQSELVVI